MEAIDADHLRETPSARPVTPRTEPAWGGRWSGGSSGPSPWTSRSLSIGRRCWMSRQLDVRVEGFRSRHCGAVGRGAGSDEGCEPARDSHAIHGHRAAESPCPAHRFRHARGEHESPCPLQNLLSHVPGTAATATRAPSGGANSVLYGELGTAAQQLVVLRWKGVIQQIMPIDLVKGLPEG